MQAYDPQAMEETARIYGPREDLTLCKSAESALQNADALVVVTEWKSFRSPDFDEIKKALTSPVIFDGRNIYEPDFIEQYGFTYYGIGRGSSVY